MARIHQLDAHVVNRIAAGEVIERPASVVKELLENSVDALSTRIEIDIIAGGTEKIRIADNGEGIHADDLLLAVTSHATSKISSDEDLDTVQTLGFRGEALASIASVSQFRIRTRTEDSATGWELFSNGGQVDRRVECGCPQGTTIEVDHLFFNTPARRKFLKKPSTEMGRISEQFSRIALANPGLHLVLRHNEKQVHDLPATDRPLERIRRFYGGDVADKLIAVDSVAEVPEGGQVRLWGYVGDPQLNRSTRRDQFLFLNGRWIQDRSLQHALAEAYRGLLMVQRHPVCFLFLEVPPRMVDVNVHPTKGEVRFQDGQGLYRQLLHTLREKFLQMEFRAGLELPVHAPGRGKSTGAAGNESSAPVAPAHQAQELDLWAARISAPTGRSGASSNVSQQTSELPATTATADVPQPAAGPQNESPGGSASTVEASVGSDTEDIPLTVSDQASIAAALAEIQKSRDAVTTVVEDCEGSDETPAPAAGGKAAMSLESTSVPAEEPPRGASGVDEFRAFQLFDCYLVVAGDDGLEIVDQHALHERILYEHFRNRILSGEVERQKLLIPEALECSAAEAAVLLEYEDLLGQSGFEISEFGGTTVLITSHPVLIPKRGLTRIVRDLAEQLEKTEGRTTRRDLLDRMLQTMACRGAIKAGQRLTPEEMRELLRQRHRVADSHHCPHGRPSSLTLTRHQLDQQFGRLG